MPLTLLLLFWRSEAVLKHFSEARLGLIARPKDCHRASSYQLSDNMSAIDDVFQLFFSKMTATRRLAPR